MGNEIWNDQKCHEAIEDALLRLALNQYAEDEGKEILKQNAELSLNTAYTMMDKSKAVIASAISKQERRSLRTPLLLRAKSIVIKAAVIFLCLSSVFYSTLAVSASFRKTIYHLVFRDEIRYTQIEYDADVSGFHNPEIYDFEYAFAFTYLPSEFQLSSFGGDQSLFEVEYANSSGNTIYFRQMSSSAIGRVDTENADRVEIVEIGDSEGLLTVKHGYSTIVWRVGGRLLHLDSDIDAETLLKIAQQVRLIY